MTIIEISESRKGTPPNIVGVDTLSILFALRHLEHLSIRTMSFVGIDNAFMKDMATAWPQLRVINLFAQNPTAPPTTQVTLEDIVVFATRYCPRLKAFKIRVNVTLAHIHDLDDVPESQEGQVTNKNIQSLGFNWLRLTNATRVLSLLGVFPNLIKLDVPRTQPGGPDAEENEECQQLVTQVFKNKMEKKRVEASRKDPDDRARYSTFA